MIGCSVADANMSKVEHTVYTACAVYADRILTFMNSLHMFSCRCNLYKETFNLVHATIRNIIHNVECCCDDNTWFSRWINAVWLLRNWHSTYIIIALSMVHCCSLFQITCVCYLYGTCVYFNFGYLMAFCVFKRTNERTNDWTVEKKIEWEKKTTQKEKSTRKTQSVKLDGGGSKKKSVLGKLPHLRWHSQMLRNHWNVLGNKMNAYSSLSLSLTHCVCFFFSLSFLCNFDVVLGWLVFYLCRVPLNGGIKWFYHVLVSLRDMCTRPARYL